MFIVFAYVYLVGCPLNRSEDSAVLYGQTDKGWQPMGESGGHREGDSPGTGCLSLRAHAIGNRNLMHVVTWSENLVLCSCRKEEALIGCIWTGL